jgi:alpha-tubulin suppressor-like RCC1 family protein
MLPLEVHFDTNDGEEVTVVAVAAGVTHSAAVTDAGMVFTWGSAEGGKLGHPLPPAGGGGLGASRHHGQSGGGGSGSGSGSGREDGGGGGGEFSGDDEWGGSCSSDGEGSCGGGGGGGGGSGREPPCVSAPRQVEFFRRAELRVLGVACGRSHTVARTDGGLVYSWGRFSGAHGTAALGGTAGQAHAHPHPHLHQQRHWGAGSGGGSRRASAQEEYDRAHTPPPVHVPTLVTALAGRHVFCVAVNATRTFALLRPQL